MLKSHTFEPTNAILALTPPEATCGVSALQIVPIRTSRRIRRGGAAAADSAGVLIIVGRVPATDQAVAGSRGVHSGMVIESDPDGGRVFFHGASVAVRADAPDSPQPSVEITVMLVEAVAPKTFGVQAVPFEAPPVEALSGIPTPVIALDVFSVSTCAEVCVGKRTYRIHSWRIPTYRTHSGLGRPVKAVNVALVEAVIAVCVVVSVMDQLAT